MWTVDDPHNTYQNLVGRAMPGYDIYHRFGESSVFGAFSWKLNKDVALKILRMGEASDPRLVKAFARQNKGLGQLPAGANLVPVFAVGKVSELVMAIMDRVRGESVARLVARNGALTWKCAVEVAMEVARAMRIAQDLGLPDHRLHPERVLLSQDGGVHVSFCCLPRGLQQGEVPLWAHLEDLRGEPGTEQSDVYVVGMILYFVATGQPPFPGDDVEKVTNAHLWARPDPAKLTNAGCPPSLVKVVDRALAKHPNDRYTNPSILMAAMKSVLNNDAPGYVIGSYREVLAQLVRDEEKDAEVAKAAAAAAAIDEPEPDAEADNPRASRVGKRASGMSGLRRASVAGRKTASMALVTPVSARPTPRGMRQISGGRRSPVPLLVGLGAGLVAFIAVLAFLLFSRNGSTKDPIPKPPPVVHEDPPPRPPVAPIDTDSPERLYARASDLEEQGSNEKALSVWGQLIAKAPDYSDVRYRRGSLLHEMGRSEEAIDDLETYVQKKPDDVKAHQLRAQIYEALGQYAQGIEACDRILEKDPGHLSALEKRAHLRVKRQDAVGAAFDYRALIDRGVERQEVLQPYAQIVEAIAWDVWKRAHSNLTPDQVRQLVADMTVLIDGRLEHPLIVLGRGRLILREATPENAQTAKRDLDAAIALYDRAAPPGTIHPDRGLAYACRVQAQALLGKPAEAHADAQKAFSNGLRTNMVDLVFRWLCTAFQPEQGLRWRYYAILSVAAGGFEPDREAQLSQVLANEKNKDIDFTAAGVSEYVEPGPLLVLGVERNGWGGGIQKFDQVLSYDGVATPYVWDLRRAVLASRGKGPVVLRVRHQTGQEEDVRVPAGEFPVSIAPVMTLK